MVNFMIIYITLYKYMGEIMYIPKSSEELVKSAMISFEGCMDEEISLILPKHWTCFSYQSTLKNTSDWGISKNRGISRNAAPFIKDSHIILQRKNVYDEYISGANYIRADKEIPSAVRINRPYIPSSRWNSYYPFNLVVISPPNIHSMDVIDSDRERIAELYTSELQQLPLTQDDIIQISENNLDENEYKREKLKDSLNELNIIIKDIYIANNRKKKEFQYPRILSHGVKCFSYKKLVHLKGSDDTDKSYQDVIVLIMDVFEYIYKRAVEDEKVKYQILDSRKTDISKQVPGIEITDIF